MKRNLSGLSRQYQEALRKHLDRQRRDGLAPAHKLGHSAMSLGLETLDMARIHEQALIEVVSKHPSSGKDGLFRRAGTFFAAAITPLERTHRNAREINIQLNRLNEALIQRALQLAQSNQQLKDEIIQRKAAEVALKKSERHYNRG
jgi:hypothetical protein